MCRWTYRVGAVGVLIVAGLLGCAGGGGDAKKDKEAADEEKQVKEQFENLKKALDITGKSVLKTAPFHDKYDPIEDAKIDKVAIKNDKATVSWKNDEGEKGDVIMFKQKGEWRAHLMTPRGPSK
jgi:hypothetical protein